MQQIRYGILIDCLHGYAISFFIAASAMQNMVEPNGTMVFHNTITGIDDW